MKIRILTIAVLALALLATFGCKEKNELPVPHSVATDTALAIEPRTDTSTATSPSSPGGTAIIPSTSGGTTVLVLLQDNSLAVQTDTIPPGPAVITVTNSGPSVHSLSVEGPGLAQQTENIAGGATATMNTTFSAGSYRFFCSIGEHATTNGETTTVLIQAR